MKRTKIKRARKRPRLGGSGIIYPLGLQARYGWSAPTRWRAEHDGRLPPRDVRIGGVLVGWRPETIERAERGELDLKPFRRRTVRARMTTDAAPPGLPEMLQK